MSIWNEETILNELKQIKQQYGKIKSCQWLSKIGRSDLVGAINKRGGIRKFKILIDEPVRSTWNENKIINTLKEECNTLNRCPSTNELRKTNSPLLRAIENSNYNYAYYQRKLGYEPITKPKGYWQVWENLKNSLKPLVTDNQFPTQRMITENSEDYLIRSIQHFGGMIEVAKRMNCKLPNESFKVTSDGHYVRSSYEYIFDEFLYSRGIQHEVDGLIHPDYKYRYDFKINDIYIEIWGYEQRETGIAKRYRIKRKAKEELYNKLGLTLISIESDSFFRQDHKKIEQSMESILENIGIKSTNTKTKFDINNISKHCYFWNEERVIAEIKEFMKSHNEFPTGKILSENQRGDLKDAIKRFGGFKYFRDVFNVPQAKQYDWCDEKIIEELKLICESNNGFPSYDKLKELKRHDLIRAINRCGGYPKFRQILGYPEIRRSSTYWTDEVIVSQLKDIANKLNKQPTYMEVRKENSKLGSAIDRSKKGLTFFRNLV